MSAVPQAAHAVAGWYLLVNVNSKMGLQAVDRSRGAAAQQQPVPSGEPSQLMQWKLFDRGTVNGHRLVSLRNAGTSNWYGLAISAGGTADGDHAILWTYLPNNAEQMWELIPALPLPPSPPAWTLRNYNSGKCLAIPGSSKVAGTHAIQWSCNGLPDQMWILREAV